MKSSTMFYFNVLDIIPFLHNEDKKKLRCVSKEMRRVIESRITIVKSLVTDLSVVSLYRISNLTTLKLSTKIDSLQGLLNNLFHFKHLKCLYIEIAEIQVFLTIDGSSLVKLKNLKELYLTKAVDHNQTTPRDSKNDYVYIEGVKLDFLKIDGVLDVGLKDCCIQKLRYENQRSIALDFQDVTTTDIQTNQDGDKVTVEEGAPVAITGTYNQVFKMMAELESSKTTHVTIRDSFLYDYSSNGLSYALMSSNLVSLSLCSVVLPEELWSIFNISSLRELSVVDVITRADFLSGLYLPNLENLRLSLDELDLRYPYEVSVASIIPFGAPKLKDVHITLDPQYSNTYPSTQLVMAILPPAERLLLQTYGDTNFSLNIRPLSLIQGGMRSIDQAATSKACDWVIPLFSKLEGLHVVGFSAVKLVCNRELEIQVGLRKLTRNSQLTNKIPENNSYYEHASAGNDTLTGVCLSVGEGHCALKEFAPNLDSFVPCTRKSADSISFKRSPSQACVVFDDKYFAVRLELVYNGTLFPKETQPDPMDKLWTSGRSTVTSWSVRGGSLVSESPILPTTIVMDSISPCSSLCYELRQGCTTLDFSKVDDFYNMVLVRDLGDTVLGMEFPIVETVRLGADQRSEKPALHSLLGRMLPCLKSIQIDNQFCLNDFDDMSDWIRSDEGS